MHVRILQNACWPHSGPRYSVWVGSAAVMQTNSLEAAEACAEIRRANPLQNWKP